MALPTTGKTWRDSGVAEVDNRFNARGGLAAILIRDNRGAATNISPYAAGSPPTVAWSPFAQDGQLRDDLLAQIRVNGEWTTNPNPNEGFWVIGANTEDGGLERAPDIKEDNQMILQSNFPFDTDLVSEGIVLNFTGVETLKPLMKRLRMNLRLSDEAGNPIVEDAGTKGFAIGKPVDVESPERQILALFARTKGGKTLYTAEGYGLCKLTNIGNFRRSKTDPDAGQLGYTILPDPFLVGKDPNNPTSNDLVPQLYVEWISGDGWTVIGGVPVFPGSAPTATPASTGTATLVFDEAVGAGDPFTYTVEKAVTPTFSTWTAATVGSTSLDTPSANKVTMTVTGLTANTYKLRVKATGTNGQTATSQVSSSVTTT